MATKRFGPSVVVSRWGATIRVCRVARGFSQKELAEMSGLTSSHLSLIEAGKRNPSAQTTERLARELQISPVILLAAATASLDEHDLSAAFGRWIGDQIANAAQLSEIVFA